MLTSFFEIEEEEKPTPTFEAIGESTSSLLECIIRLEHKEEGRKGKARRKESDQGSESSLLAFNPLRGSSGEGNQSQGVKSTFLV